MDKANKNGMEVVAKVFTELYYSKLADGEFRNNTVELRNVHLTFDPNEATIEYGPARKTNLEYVAKELDWYLSQDLCIKGHPGIESNKIWQSCATSRGYINSNYGTLVFKPDELGMSQYDYCKSALMDNKFTRQALMIYTRPSIHRESCDGEHADYDFICTTHVQVFITNDNKLDYIVNMRSNDAIFGLQNDYCWHHYVYHKLLSEMQVDYPELDVGHIYWNAGSMHVYERHYDLLKYIVKGE